LLPLFTCFFGKIYPKFSFIIKQTSKQPDEIHTYHPLFLKDSLLISQKPDPGYQREEILQRLERILPTVGKPGRYTGGELNQVIKDWPAVRTRVALVFPELYDLGMSNLGLAILYDQINQRPDALAERAFSPWVDMELAMRKFRLPFFSLESKHPLADFDILAFSLPYESLYTNTLNALDLAQVPVRSSDRSSTHPLVIAGGHACYNPEPMHAFIDAFVIGEGEEVIHEIIDLHQAWYASEGDRDRLLRDLAGLEGVYIPRFYRALFLQDGRFAGLERAWDGAPSSIRKRIVPTLPPPVTRFVVPYIDTVHNRAQIEIMRGCTRGCRFCQAGMVTRPVRERPLEEILAAIEAAVEATGYEEVSLVSLSSSDYTQVIDLVQGINQRFAGRHLAISLPSLRIETVSVDLMDALTSERRSGFTLAPEAATDALRNTINKPIDSSQLLETAEAIYRRGWPTIKLYFMIGQPGETDADVQAIASLCQATLAVGRREIGKRARLHVGISTFVPKAHTPFQWAVCDSIGSIRAKQSLLKDLLRGGGFKLTWTRPEETMFEAWLARGDRRMSEVIFKAWKRGARFDAWLEHFRYDLWLEAFSACGLQPHFYVHRPRALDAALPWDHIQTGVRKKYLQQDFQASQQGEPRSDCRLGCEACGILPAFAGLRSLNPGFHWKCPEIIPLSAQKRSRTAEPFLKTS
jgi:radical SAM family uncharacterized protein